MPKTFADLGIGFPLFTAPVDQAGEYAGVKTCSICGNAKQHCFELGIGCALMISCPGCGTINGLDADDREDVECRKCGGEIAFPEIEDDAIVVCYGCLRAGKAAITKDTELGMISWEQAFEGQTHGLPGMNRDDFETVKTDSDWTAARLPQEMMFELLRTPNYLSIQGEQWQFCCKRPMVYLGQWHAEDFDENAEDGDGRTLFEKVVPDASDELWDDGMGDETGIYVFKCPTCGKLKAHWDLA
jgi:uncharacterized protein CbrC (UPF0167 family)